MVRLTYDGEGALHFETWGAVNVFELEKDCQQPLTKVFMSIWQKRQLSKLSKARSVKVVDFIAAVEKQYPDNPYHNRMHAAEVTSMAYSLWSSLSQLPQFTGYFTEVDLLVLIVAAAIHDMGHPGVNNDFLVKTKNNLAIRYHDRAVLENFHLASAFELMKDTGIQLLEHNLPSPPVASLRNRVVDMVLATDMAVHKRLVEEIDNETTRYSGSDIDKCLLERSLVHLADIGHPLKPVAQHKNWAQRVTEEFFAQGDKEKELGFTPLTLFDRKEAPALPNSQIGFMNFMVLPTWKPLASLLGDFANEPALCFQRNLQAWEAMAKEMEEQKREIEKQERSRKL